MREYAKVAPTFWTGETGKKIRGYGRDVQAVALYLITCPSSNWLGLYYLPLPTLCHEVSINQEGASKALQSLSEIDFAYYDHDSETVWVPGTAKFQIGERLKPGDNRIVGIKKDLQQFYKSPFYRYFYERYGGLYHLSMEEAPSKPLLSPFKAPSKPVTGTGAGAGTGTGAEIHTARSDSKSESSEPQEAAEKPLHRKSAKQVQNAGVDPEQPAVITLPLADKSDHCITAADIAELSSLYPGVDPEQELLKAKGWLIANPTRRKTHRGIARFIHGWLSRAQDRGNGKYAKDPPPVEPGEEFEDPDEPMRGHPDLIEQERARRRAKYNNDPALIEKARAEWRDKHGYE